MFAELKVVDVSIMKELSTSTLVTSLGQLHTLHVPEREGILDCLRLRGDVFDMVLVLRAKPFG